MRKKKFFSMSQDWCSNTVNTFIKKYDRKKKRKKKNSYTVLKKRKEKIFFCSVIKFIT